MSLPQGSEMAKSSRRDENPARKFPHSLIVAEWSRQIVGKTWSLIELERDRPSSLTRLSAPLAVSLAANFRSGVSSNFCTPHCRRTFKCKYTFLLIFICKCHRGSRRTRRVETPREWRNGVLRKLEREKKNMAMGSWYAAITSLYLRRLSCANSRKLVPPPFVFAFDHCLPVVESFESNVCVTHVYTYVCVGGTLKFHYRYYVNTLHKHLCKSCVFLR